MFTVQVTNPRSGSMLLQFSYNNQSANHAGSMNGNTATFAVTGTGFVYDLRESTYRSPMFTAQEGQTYIWDMSAGTIRNASAAASGGSTALGGLLQNKLLLYGIGGFIALKWLKIIK